MNEILKKDCLTGEITFSLEMILESYKKTRLKAIASQYGVKLSDKLTKLQMITEVFPLISTGLSLKLKRYSDDDLKMLLTCMHTEAFTEQEANDIMQSLPYLDGIVYFYIHDETFIPVVPKELASKINEFCANHIFASNEDDMTRCAKAALLIYGNITPELLCHIFAAYTEKECSLQESELFLQKFNADHFTDNTIIIDDAAKDLDYDMPSKKEINAYSANGFDTTDYYYRQIISFLYAKSGSSYQDSKKLMQNIQHWCMSDGELPVIFKYFQEAKPQITAEQFNFLLDMISELSFRTRKWTLKGNKPCDISGMKQKRMPHVQAKKINTASKVETVKATPKVGRNDLCPCGSGKKYKKCCGKNKAD